MKHHQVMKRRTQRTGTREPAMTSATKCRAHYLHPACRVRPLPREGTLVTLKAIVPRKKKMTFSVEVARSALHLRYYFVS